jgi:hypothetical protein
VLAVTLLDDYNDYRFHTASIQAKRAAGAYIRSLKATPGRLAAFEALGVWCQGRGIDPRRWLHSLFASRHWLFAPPLKHLTSEKHIPRYQAMQGSMPMYRDRVVREDQQRAENEGRVFHAGRDLSHGVELLKMRYQQLGRPGRCMEAIDETYGYHPQSQICSGCPVAAACEAFLRSRVGYDIQAVRRGDLSLQQAQAERAYAGG